MGKVCLGKVPADAPKISYNKLRWEQRWLGEIKQKKERR